MKLKLWELAYNDYLQGMKYADIAEKHGVALSTVKSWAVRYWKHPEKGCKKSCDPPHLQPEKVAKKKKRGAPFGSQNAKGHGAPKGNQNAKGKHRPGGGAPVGNQNGLITGEYAKILTSTFTAEEVGVFNAAATDPLDQIDRTIQFLAVREFRMLKLRDALLRQREELRQKNSANTFDLVQDTILLKESRKEKDHIMVTTEQRLSEKILAIEEALTRVQEKKIRAIEAKQRILKDRAVSQDVQDIHITIMRKEKAAE
ncbi:hypothetical protein [uncultured Megasphaera sp.]|uniref:hypothetical protein n=1 Tax=uncultured Megasphaera sp. TaxID=165188 RepID=UPI0037835299